MADKNGDKRITIDDFRKILDCGEDDEDEEHDGTMQHSQMDDDMEGMDGERDEDDSDEEAM